MSRKSEGPRIILLWCSVFKWVYKNEEDRVFSWEYADRTWINGSKLNKDKFRLGIKKKYFCAGAHITVAWVAQRGCRCPTPGNIQYHIGQGSGQHDLLEGVLPHCRRLEPEDL